MVSTDKKALIGLGIVLLVLYFAVPRSGFDPVKPRIMRSISEINAIELALTSMMADAGVNTLGELFDPDAVREYIGVSQGGKWGLAEFEKAQELYTRCLYTLIREGRQTLVDNDSEMGIGYRDVLNEDVVRKLGTFYMNDLGFDPWGKNLYQIWPGPWEEEQLGPIPFRIRDFDEAYASVSRTDFYEPIQDCFTVTTIPEGMKVEEWFRIPVGYKAPLDKNFYIWSYGENLTNDQVIMGSSCDAVRYRGGDWGYWGGADDINNWDKGCSWEVYYR